MARVVKAFELGVSSAQDIRAFSVAGRYQKGGVDAAVYGGTLCVKNGRAPSSIFHESKNDEAFIMEDAVQGSTEVYICNPDIAAFCVNEAQGTSYRQGSGNLGNAVPKEFLARFTLATVGTSCKFGLGNFVSEPTPAMTYAVIGTGANAGLLVAQAARPASGFALEIEEKEHFTEGAYDGGAGYRCRVISV